jgi:ubiquinone/menaquinone biosynthesis C-methylase UbiE
MIRVADTEFWNRAARKYAADPIADIPGYERTIERVRGVLRPKDNVLELGCGTGSTALLLADEAASYLATDFSAEMIAIAEAKLAQQPVSQLTFQITSAETLAAEGSRFDAVLGFNYLHLVDDLPGTLEAIRDLLAPGGVFISKTACLSDMNPLIRLAIPVMQCFGKAPHVNVFSATALRGAIQNAGFAVKFCEYHGSGRKDARSVIIAHETG